MLARNAFHAVVVSAMISLEFFNLTPASADDSTWAKLAEGGKVVLMRHSSVKKGREAGNSLIRDPSCREERNLSDEGQHEAKVIGERFRKYNIAVEEVRYSPYCRTAETARIAFGKGTAADFLSLLEVLQPDAASAQTAKLNEVIGSYTGKGNLVLVTHEPNINAVSFEIMNTSDFLVLQPKGGSKFEELGVVRWADSN